MIGYVGEGNTVWHYSGWHFTLMKCICLVCLSVNLLIYVSVSLSCLSVLSKIGSSEQHGCFLFPFWWMLHVFESDSWLTVFILISTHIYISVSDSTCPYSYIAHIYLHLALTGKSEIQLIRMLFFSFFMFCLMYRLPCL